MVKKNLNDKGLIVCRTTDYLPQEQITSFFINYFDCVFTVMTNEFLSRQNVRLTSQNYKPYTFDDFL